MFPFYAAITKDQCKMIHESALKVLDRFGVVLNHPKALDVLSDLGARVSDDKNRVFFPPELVEKMLSRAPREFLCAARDPKNDLPMKLGESYVWHGGGPIQIYDMRNCTARKLTLEDAADSVRLINALPQINSPATMTPQNVNMKTYDIETVKMVLENTTKHFWALTIGANHLKYELELAAASVGGRENLKKRPVLSGAFCVIAPLRFPSDEIDRLILCGEYGVPVRTPLTVLMGGSAPYTMAGSMTQMTAEFLASVTIAQALCPGIGQWYYTLLQFMDMRTTHSVIHGPELMALDAAAARMAEFYGIPSLENTLFSGDVQPDQVIYQYGINGLMGLLNNVTFNVGAGSLDNGNLYSHQALVIVDEIMAYLRSFLKGMEINTETLAVDEIVECAERGEYLTSEFTVEYLRKEPRHITDIITFPNTEEMKANSSGTIFDRAEAKFRKIMKESPKESVLKPEVVRELDKILAAAQRELS